jgi:hypothetical protein
MQFAWDAGKERGLKAVMRGLSPIVVFFIYVLPYSLRTRGMVPRTL